MAEKARCEFKWLKQLTNSNSSPENVHADRAQVAFVSFGLHN